MDYHKKNNLLSFQFVNWPQEIRKLSLKCVLIQLPQNIVEYLKQDQVFVSENWKYHDKLGQQDETDVCPRFLDFELIIKEIFDNYEYVLPKLNLWAPKDCENWLQDLKCHNMNDLFTSLKTSTLLMDNMTSYAEWFSDNQQMKIYKQKDPIPQQTFDGNYLLLKKWYKLDQLQEYRLFVYKKKLRGISQRHLHAVKKMDAGEKEFFKQRLLNFTEENITKYMNVEDFAIDIFIDIPPKSRIIVIDINPWREFTTSKLFSYEELEGDIQLELRIVEDVDQIRQEDYTLCRLPSEFTELQSNEEMFELLQQICKIQNQEQ